MFAQMPPEWKDAYEAGIFTEFMEQRAPGHTVLDDKIYRKGLRGLQADIDRQLAALDFLQRPARPTTSSRSCAAMRDRAPTP